MGLYLLFADKEPGAEVYSAATKRDQARIVHGEAIRMVRASPALSSRIAIFRDNLSVEKTASKFEPLGADEDTLDGLNVHGAIIDELHAHKTRGVLDVIDTATGSRRQPLLFEITTAGFDRQSVCWEQHEYGRNVLEGLVKDDSFFCFVASIDDDDDWRNREVWIKANPNLGISVKIDDLERKAEKAKELPASQNAFRRLHLNQWTEQEDRWIEMEGWKRCDAPVDPDELKGLECYGGLDLSSTTDVTAVILVFPLEGDFHVLPFFWIPKDNIRKRSERDKVPYDVWVREGLMFATEGNIVDYDAIRMFFRELVKIYNIKEVALDRWNATQLATQLEGDGLTMVPFGQGFASMSAPTKELEKLILGRRLRHGGHPVLQWMAGNVAVKQDAAGNLKPAKDKSREKIDGIVALIMAIDRATRHGDESSVYESRGLLSLGL
ncbi:putative Protein YmfN [Gammaproteobacteria bacterium]